MGRQQILKGLFLSAVFAAFGIGQAQAVTISFMSITQLPNYSTKNGFITHGKFGANRTPTTGTCFYGEGTLYGKVLKVAGNDADAALEPEYVWFTSNSNRAAHLDSITGETSCSDDTDGDGSSETNYKYTANCSGC